MKTKKRIGKETLLVDDNGLKYVEFESLKKYEDRLIHLMSTRIGGVSSGECATLNLSFKRRDSRENVIENYTRICKSTGIDIESIVISDQVHGTVVKEVGTEDRGKNFTAVQSDIKGVDGLITVSRDVTLVTHYADCVPVYLYEPGLHAAALLHSGWRSTLKSITKKALEQMSEFPGFNSDRLVAVIGPSIRNCCFEVDKDVYQLFYEFYPCERYYRKLPNGKITIDLQKIIKDDLIEFGLKDENIHDCEICTKCRNDLFFSYRGDGGKTGSLAAFMHLK